MPPSVLPFEVVLRAGESPYRQVVYAATKAIVGGELAIGDAFPSVRELSQALKINPNTAQKVVAELVRDGLLVVQPGLGTVVARVPRGGSDDKRRLLAVDVEHLLVEARRLGLTREEMHRAIDARWDALFGDDAEAVSQRGPARPPVPTVRGRR
jgi:GntR family transcriptional regulator